MSKTVLIYGGNGQLGSEIITFFKLKQFKTIAVDIRSNERADSNIVLNVNDSLQQQSATAMKGVRELLGNGKLNAIFCVAGGWAGGNASDKDFVQNTQLMISQSINSSVVAANIASAFLAEDGLLTLTGAKAALGPTPYMIGYGLAKAAVIHLTKSLADPTGGLPANSKVFCVLPITLDTSANRAAMPNGDYLSWTPLGTLCEEYYKWTMKEKDLPNGSLIVVSTENGKTSFTASQ